MIISRGNPNKISINVLELIAVVIICFGACVAYAMPENQPKILLEGENTSANSWCKKFTNLNPSARALTKLLSFAIKHTDVGPKVGHIPGILNYLADAVSRGDPAVTIPEKNGRSHHCRLSRMFTGAGGVNLSALAALPTRARAVVGAGICNLAEELAVATTAQRKQLGTDAARRQPYVRFARGLLQLPDAQLQDLGPKVQTYRTSC
jgi:hypothetical protein